jgi:phosphoribosylformylglycinamidine synthase II
MTPAELKTKQKHYRISDSEYAKICELLGREPKVIEWPLFSALWSEHCSYKSSRIHLKKFAGTITSAVLNAEGENAGVVDLGHDERIVFKMESHNHPSFIEPYQGAATGVGGILRDIFTMGARPIAIADYLCFGEPKAPRMQVIVDGVVRGIAGYGNSVGVPTVTGQTNFDPSYNQNVLVNAMAVGLLRPGEKVALSAAKGPGNLVVYVGAKTGKDGVHGAAMASESFDQDSESKKPNVQIGDPYFEKLLIESCLEVLQKNLVVSIQDMGAAGLTSSSFEMASKGNVGMRMHLDKVPVRDASILPEEILLSESQERMLLICEPRKLEELQAHFAKWGLDAVSVGEVISERKVELWWKGELLTSIDPHLLVENAPLYERPFKNWETKNKIEYPGWLEPSKVKAELSSEHHTSRKAIYRQYDQRVGLNTVRGADHDVAVLKLPDSKRGLALAVGCRPSMMKLDARIGALDAVLYPALQMSLKGFTPVAVTDCLNFGNPEKPEIMSEFVASVEAIKEASLALSAPVVSGNVSFYNETLGQNIISTPATGLVGLRENIDNLPEDMFQKRGSSVYLLSQGSASDVSASVEFAKTLRSLSKIPGVLSNQMVGLGGLALCLAKMSLGGLGVTATVEGCAKTLYQAVFEVSNEAAQFFEKSFEDHAFFVKLKKIGTVSADWNLDGKTSVAVKDLENSYNKGLRGPFESLA